MTSPEDHLAKADEYLTMAGVEIRTLAGRTGVARVEQAMASYAAMSAFAALARAHAELAEVQQVVLGRFELRDALGDPAD